MPYIFFEGKRYYYEGEIPSAPEKKVILFVHGAGGDHQWWSSQLDYFKKSYAPLAIDLPGHGLSEGMAMNSVADYRDFILSFADKYIKAPFFLAGHSMGGGVALSFARSNPNFLAGLILVGTGCRLRVLPAIINTFGKGDHFDLIPYMFSKNTPLDIVENARKKMLQVEPSVYYADMNACSSFDLTNELYAIDVPTLVLSAEEDVMTPVKYGKYLFDNMPDARLEIIKDAGHMMMVEQPVQVNRAIEAFVREVAKIG
jgi:pimeloyl-ACP methyl ester carboxylesterase